MLASLLLGQASYAAPPPSPLQQLPKLIAAGQNQKAVETADKILLKQPDSALAHYYKAKALEQLGSKPEAIASYETAALLDPGAKFAGECQARIKILSVPVRDEAQQNFSNVIDKKGQQRTPFKLKSEQSRVVTQLSDSFKQGLLDDAARLHSAADAGPALAAGIGSGPPLPAAVQRNPLQLATSIGIPSANLNAKEKAQLSKYDVIFIVDHSGSMSTRDCPKSSSRWDWLAAQVYTIGRDAQDCFPRGLRVVMFDDDAEEYIKVTPKEFVDLFKFYGPEGGTHTAHAFRTQLNAVQAKLNQGKPVMVVGLTDGLPNNPGDLQQVFGTLKAMAAQTTTPLKVSLIQIGASDQGLRTLAQLEALTYRGVSNPADAGFVQVHSFAEVVKYGLPRVLLTILNK